VIQTGSKADVLRHIHITEQQCLLEYHGNRSLLGNEPVLKLIVNAYAAAVWLFQSGYEL
jgi:hypothetical protein